MVLKAYARVPGIILARVISNDPMQGSIWEWPFAKDFCLSRKISIERPGDRQNSATSITFEP